MNASPHKDLGNEGLTALNPTSQDNVYIESSLGNNILSKIIEEEMVNVCHDDEYMNYNSISKRIQVNNVKYDTYLLAEHKKLHGSTISGSGVTSEDLGGHESIVQPMTASHATQQETLNETEMLKDGLHYRTIIDEDNVASETEHMYHAAHYVMPKTTHSNVEIIDSKTDANVGQDKLYAPAQREEEDMFPGNYKTEAELQISSHGTPRGLHRPFFPHIISASSPYRLFPVRTSHGPKDSDFQGSSSFSVLSDTPHKSRNTLYISKPTDSFSLASASSTYRKPTVFYDSPSQKPSSTFYESPHQKKPSLLYGSPPRKPLIASYESTPYKQLGISYDFPSTDLRGSPSTLNHSPQYGSAPHKTSRPSHNIRPTDSYGSPTVSYSSSPQGSRPTISEIRPLHQPSRHSYSSPPKKSPTPSYHLHSGHLYESPTSSYSSLPHDSRPSTSTKSPLHKPHRQSYSSAQASHKPLQSSEIYESPTSSYGTTHDSRLVISDTQKLGSQKILHSAPSLRSPSPSYDSQSSELYESPTSLSSYSTHSSKSSDGSLLHRLHRPSYGSPPKKSQRPSHNSEFTDAYESPSSHSSSHDSRISSPSHSSLFGNSSWSHAPIHDSPSSVSTVTSYGSPSNFAYESPSSTFQESLSYSEGGSGDSSHTFVKTDHHGHVKWGVHHSVNNQKAGSHQ